MHVHVSCLYEWNHVAKTNQVFLYQTWIGREDEIRLPRLILYWSFDFAIKERDVPLPMLIEARNCTAVVGIIFHAVQP
jgi:hypothetical protein